MDEPMLPGPDWVSPTEMLYRRWLLWAGGPLAGLIVVAAILTWALSGRSLEPVVEPSPAAAAAPAPPDRASDEPPPARLDPRWIPDDARWVVTVAPAPLAGQSGADRLFEAARPWWAPVLSPVLDGLGLSIADLRRVSWAVCAIDREHEGDRPLFAGAKIGTVPGVLVFHVDAGVDPDALAGRGSPIDAFVAGKACRRLPGGAWPHPFVVLDGPVVVTGEAELLATLSARAKPRWASEPIARLLADVSGEAHLAMLLDLQAVRRSGGALPPAVLEVWQPDRDAADALETLPEGLGLSLRFGATLRGELEIVCREPAAAAKVHAALAQLLPAVKTSLAGRVEAAAELVREGRLSPEDAQRYQTLLGELRAGLDLTHCELADDAVRVTTDWGRDPVATGLAALESRGAIRADWIASAQGLDRSRHEALGEGLQQYAAAEQRFPDGAVGGALLPPETRLSWIAAMLPYLGREDWHRQLAMAYSWDAERNRPVAVRRLPEVLNPALGPTDAPDGYPPTHFVGVAGVGADAGRLPADDPRAGVFGFGRQVDPSKIPDGASNTIATLGASGQLGPWAAGGHATVRPLAQRPYVNGPDGFGTGQPDGMLAGMADGSVRFVSKDVDPTVLEQLATVNSGKEATVDSLDPGGLPAVAPEAPPAAAPPADALPDPPAQAAPPAPSPADVKAKASLETRIAKIEFADVPLGHVVAVLKDLGAVEIDFDQAALAAKGVSLDDRVSVRLENATVGEALDKVLSTKGLKHTVENGRARVVAAPQP
ncbi:MAG: DUF1559 domain-containing protein [Pirellulales bacterium]|nr:DUF1559 domain-containing protein [Pirellulales bacterium]